MNDKEVPAGSGEGHSRQREELLQGFWGKDEADTFKAPRESWYG